MNKKRSSKEESQLKDLPQPLPHDSGSRKELNGLAKKFDRPTHPAESQQDWDAWFDGESVSEDFGTEREKG